MAEITNLFKGLAETPVDAFGAVQDARKRRAALQASTVLSQRSTFKPDMRANDVNLSFALKKEADVDMPPQFIGDQNRPDLEFQLDQRRINRLTQESERAANYLSNPINAELAYDDLNTLGFWGRIGTAIGRAGDQTFDAARLLPQFYGFKTMERALDDRDKTVAEIWGEETSTPAQGPIENVLKGGLDVTDTLTRILLSRVVGLGSIEGAPTKEGVAEGLERVSTEIGTEAAERREVFPTSRSYEEVAKKFAEKPEGMGPIDSFTHFVGVASDDLPAFISFAAEVGIESIPGAAAAVATLYTTRNPGLARSVLGASSGLRAWEGDFNAIAQEAGYDLTDLDSVKAMVKDPAFTSRLGNQPFAYAMTVAVFDAASGGLATQRLAKSASGNFMLQMLAQAAAGSSGEAFGKLWSGREVDWTEVILEGIVELVAAPLEIVGMGGRSTLRRAQSAAHARDRKQIFQAMADTTGESKLSKRSQAKYGEMVAELTKDGPVENLYVDPDAMETLFQSQGITAEEFFETVPGLSFKEYEQARDLGHDYKMPTATYAANIIGSRFEAPMQDHLKFGPMEMSLSEADTLKKEIEAAVKDHGTTLDMVEKEARDMSTEGQQAFEAITGQLRQAGRTPEVAAREALPLVRFAETQAKRMGVQPSEWLDKYALPVFQSEDTGQPAPTSEALNTRVFPGSATTLTQISPRGQAATTPLRDAVVTDDELVGDGRKFTKFFADVTAGRRQRPGNLDAYVPVIELPQEVKDFASAREKFSGNFEDHIRTSIPGYREMQDAVGYALSRTIGEGSILDLGASEGAMVKAVVETNPAASAVALDPNQDMQRTFKSKPQVDRVEFSLTAFGSAEEAGSVAWTEDDGTEIKVFDPEGRRFDVVHEAMVFQFISNRRNAQIHRVKELLTEDGLFLTFEKFGGPADIYNANEDKKDDYKALYYDAETLEAKRKEVLQSGGDEVEGMTDLQVSVAEMEATLSNNFEHVAQVWDSGNFKGFAASDDRATLDRFLSEMADLSSPFQTVDTPRWVSDDVEVQSLAELTDAAAFTRPGWFILSATLGAPDAERTAALEADLTRRGLPHEPVEGMYQGEPDGTAFLVLGDAATAEALGAEYGQESILDNRGLVFTDGSGRANVPFDGGVFGEEAEAQDFFSRRADGSAFSLNLKFAEEAPVESSVDERRVLFQSAREPIFYSELRRQIEGAKQEVAMAKDWAAIINRLPGVKKAEVQWTGVLEFLAAMDPKAKVTRAELAGFVARSEPSARIMTDVLSGMVEEDRDEAINRLIEDEYRVEFGEPEVVAEDPDYLLETGIDLYGDEIAEEMVEEGLVDSVEDIENNIEFQTRASNTAEEAYLENPVTTVSITINFPGDFHDNLATATIDPDGAVYHDGEYYPDLGDLEEHLRDRYMDEAYEYASGEVANAPSAGNVYDSGTKFEDYTESGGDDYREVLISYPDLETEGPNARFDTPEPFVQDAHFNTPNILVHTRLKDRRDASGKKVLFVEEVQSDLNTAWREAGGQPETPGPEDLAARDRLLAELDGEEARRAASEGREARTALRELAIQRARLDVTSIDRPLTPFEGEAASALAMKRMIRMAAEEGYDKLAWTPAYMQARRSRGAVQNVVKEVRWTSSGIASDWPFDDITRDGIARVVTLDGVNGQDRIAVDADGVMVKVLRGRNFKTDDIKGTKLSTFLGGVMATRIMEENEGTITGQNIVIGGDGYKIVYDQQIKKFVEKFMKKYGGKLTIDKSMPDFSLPAEHPLSPAELTEKIRALGYEKTKARMIEMDPERFRPDFWRALEQNVAASIEEDIAAHRRQAERNREMGDAYYVKLFEKTIAERGQPAYLETRRMDEVLSLTAGREAYQILDLPIPEKRSDPVWSVEITDEMREQLLQAYPLFQKKRKGGPRGQIMLPPPGGEGAPVATLFANRDLSTVLHESGHFYLHALERMKNEGVEHATAEWNTLVEWWAKNIDTVAEDAGITVTQMERFLRTGDAGSPELNRMANVGIQEYFARGMEAYMLEGRAPSNALRAAFESFMAWLTAVYRDIKDLNVELDDEVRGVFDRLLATDAEINEARAETNVDDLIAETAKDMGLDPETYQRLVDLSREARDEARQMTLRDIMAPIRAMREAENKEERKRIAEQVTDEVMAKRHNRVIEWLGSSRWIGGEVPEQIAEAELRLDPALLAEEHGEGVEGRLPRASRPLTLKGSGVSADDIAGLFGYRTGADLIQDLLRAPKAKDEIKNRVDAAMRERANDPMDAPGGIEQIAVDALHGDKRGQLIVAELRAINRLSSRKQTMTTRAQARAIARELIARMPVREAIASHRYLAAERKFAEQATRELAKDNTEAAFEAKRRQLLNHSMYAESRLTAEAVGKTERLAGKLRKRSTRKNLAGEYLNAIDELLDRYDFRQISGAAEDRRGSLLAYVEMMKAQGRDNELAIPDKVLHDARRRPYKTLSVRELEGVHDSLKNIEHTARMKQKLRDAKAQRDLDAVVDEIVAAFEENIGDGSPPARIPTRFGKIRDATKEYVDLIENADTILRRIDGWGNRGAAYRNLKDLVDEAEVTALMAREKAAEGMEALYRVYTLNERRKMTTQRRWDGFPDALSKWDIISIMLNTGNKDNFERLTSLDAPGAFTRQQIETLAENLDARDWAFVQSVWDYTNSYWDQIAARERRVTGVAPKKVEASMMIEAPGNVTGGYYPIKYDGRSSATVAEEQTQELFTNMQQGRFGKAQTRNGHTKERAAGGGGRTVQLGMQVFHGHISQVVHDLAFSEAVNATWKILRDPRIRAAFEARGMVADLRSLEMWVQDVAAGRLAAYNVVGRVARHFKAGFTISKLAFNFSTVALQVTGLPQSAAVVGKKNMAKALGKYAGQGFYPAAARIRARSAFMANRETTFQRDIYDLLDNTQSGPLAGTANEVSQVFMRTGFWLMQKVQFYSVDVPTWMAAYESGLADGMSDEEAGMHADRMVARAQASGLFADRSAIERGTTSATQRQSDFIRLFTALGSYMFTKYNVATEVAGRAKRDVTGLNLKSGAALINAVVDMSLLFVLEGVLYAAVKGRLPDDEDDDDTWLAFLARETALSAVGTLPFIRDAGSAAQGFSGGGSYGGVVETLARGYNTTTNFFGGEELTQADFKAAIDAAGIAVPGVPSSFMKIVVDVELARQRGEEVSPLEYLFGRR